MLKRPLCSLVRVLKNPVLGTSEIHRNSLLPVRTFENHLKTTTNQTGQEPKFWAWRYKVRFVGSQYHWWVSKRGGMGSVECSEVVSLVAFYVSLISILHILQHFFILLFTIILMSEVHSARLSHNNCIVNVGFIVLFTQHIQFCNCIIKSCFCQPAGTVWGN